MVRYRLSCADGRGFGSRVPAASAFDELAARGLLSCAECGSSKVERALMAPAVATRDSRSAAPLAAPRAPREAMLAAMRRHVEENSDYVGLSFATEARKMHL